MVINQLDIPNVTRFKTKNDPPVAAYGHRPETSQVTFEWVKAKAGQINGSGAACAIEHRQNSFAYQPILLRSSVMCAV
jgi:hypothetical protein